MSTARQSPTIHGFAKRFAYQHWRWYLTGLVALIVTNYITLKIPELAKNIVNILESQQDFSEAKGVALLMIGLGVLLIFVRSLSRVFIFWPGRKIEADTKRALIERLLHLSSVVFGRFSLGDLISRLSNDASQLRILYAFAFLQLANLVFLTIFTISQMVSVHPGLTIASLSPLVLMIGISRYFMPKMHQFSRQNQIALGDMTSVVTETFINAHIIQSNNAETSFLDRIKTKNQEVYDSEMKLIMIRNFVFPLMAALSGVCEVVVIFYGGYLAIKNQLSIGDILAFNVYISFLSWPLTSIGVVLGIVQRAKAAIERIDLVLQSPLRDQASQHEVEPRGIEQRLEQTAVFELKNLKFSYPEDSARLEQTPFQLSVDHLSIFPGEKIGVSGSVGSGKTTFFHLLAALLEAESGKLYHRGRDVSTLSLSTIRERVIYIPQTSHLFSDSLQQNILLANPDLEFKEVEEIVRLCQVDEDIRNFPQGFETQIGERGIRLSGGQKQRLALARGLARSWKQDRNNCVLLMDDALSAVDEQTEMLILEELFKIFPTVVISSHRHSALIRCQRWFLFENGEVNEAGLERLGVF